MSSSTSAPTVIELTKQLVAIPSYVDEMHNESQLVDFLVDFLQENFPTLSVQRQSFDAISSRANIIMKGKNPPKLFVIGHIDTVRPKDNWLTNPIVPTTQDGRLYGLGASDMKGSLAAFLCALIEEKSVRLDDLTVLLYGDEEYDFAGIKHFMETQTLTEMPPEMILSLDGSLVLSSGCRGLVEFNAQVSGESGHSSNPANGRNVIMRTAEAVRDLEKTIAQYQDAELGESTLNVAYLQGGSIERQDDTISWQREGNIIPDYAELTMELRTARKDLDAAKAEELFKTACETRGLVVESIFVRHDLSPWPVSYASDKVALLENCYKEAGVTFSKMDRRFSGFIDVQMICEKVNTPTFIIGTGGENKHGANENVLLENLQKATELYKVILSRLLGEKENE